MYILLSSVPVSARVVSLLLMHSEAWWSVYSSGTHVLIFMFLFVLVTIRSLVGAIMSYVFDSCAGHALILLQLLLITYRVAWGQDDMETVSSRCTPRGKVPPVSFSSTHNAYLFANDEQGVATPNTTWTTIASNQILQENFEFSSLCSLEIVAVIVGHRGPCRITVTATWTLAAGDNVNRQLLKKDVNTCPAVDRQELTALNRSMQLSDISHTQSSNVHVLVGIQNDATAAGRSPHSATSSCSHCQVLTVELRGAVKPRAFLVGQCELNMSINYR